MRTASYRTSACIAIAAFLCTDSGNALTINVNHTGGATADMLAGMADAVTVWESYLNAPGVTINIDFDGGVLGAGILGGASSNKTTQSWTDARNALIANSSSADDATAVANLAGAGGFDLLINYTTENGNSATPYLDNNGSANNTNVNITKANAKVLGLIDPVAGTDASITFATNYANFDFDRGDGIAGGTIDFVGVAIHEIGHVLGFTSVVDLLDNNHNFGEDNFMPSLLDIFRFSSDSTAQSAIDLSVVNEERYYSIDGGTNYLNTLERASGQQASHWRDNQGIGIMDPTAAWAAQMNLTGNDLRFYDLIGWSLTGAGTALVTANASAPTPIPLGAGAGGGAPEPQFLGLFVMFAWATYGSKRMREEAR